MSHYQSGDEPVPGYRLVSFIGQGSYGEVWNAVGPGQIDVALKFLNLDSKQGLKEFRSLGLVKKLRHVHLVPIHAIWLRDVAGNVLSDAPGYAAESESVRINLLGSKELVIAMGLGDKNLAQRADEMRNRGGIPLHELLRYLEGAAKGIDYLNEPIHPPGNAAIIHCDIKPANLLLVGREVQVCDYGVARALSTDMRKTLGAGTPAYAPPELINNEPSPQTDQYSLAISYFEIRTGRLPFDESKAVFANLTGSLDLTALPLEERRVIARATHLQPDKRYPTTLEMVDDLKAATGVTVTRSGVVGTPQERRLPEPPGSLQQKPKPGGSGPWSTPLPSASRPTPKSDLPAHSGTVRFETKQPEKPASPPPPAVEPDDAEGTVRFPPGFSGNPVSPMWSPVAATGPKEPSTWRDPIPAPENDRKPTGNATRNRARFPLVGAVVGILLAVGVGVGIYLALSTTPSPDSVAKPGETTVRPVGPPEKQELPPPPAVQPALPRKGIEDLRACRIQSPADMMPFLALAAEVKANLPKDAPPDEFRKLLANKIVAFCTVWDTSPAPGTLKPLIEDAGLSNILASLEESQKGLPWPRYDLAHLDQPYTPGDARKVVGWLHLADQLLASAGVPESGPKRVEFAHLRALAEWSREDRKLDEVRARLNALQKRCGSKEYQWPEATGRARAQLYLIEARSSDRPEAKADRYTKAFDLLKDVPAADKEALVQLLVAAAQDLWLQTAPAGATFTAADATAITRLLFRAAEESPADWPKVKDLGGADARSRALAGFVADIWGLKHPNHPRRSEAFAFAVEQYDAAVQGSDPITGLRVRLLRPRLLTEPWRSQGGKSMWLTKPTVVPDNLLQPLEHKLRAATKDAGVGLKELNAEADLAIALMQAELAERDLIKLGLFDADANREKFESKDKAFLAILAKKTIPGRIKELNAISSKLCALDGGSNDLRMVAHAHMYVVLCDFYALACWTKRSKELPENDTANADLRDARFDVADLATRAFAHREEVRLANPRLPSDIGDAFALFRKKYQGEGPHGQQDVKSVLVWLKEARDEASKKTSPDIARERLYKVAALAFLMTAPGWEKLDVDGLFPEKPGRDALDNALKGLGPDEQRRWKRLIEGVLPNGK